MATIPILKVKKFVDLLIAFIKTDYDSAVDKNDSFLYRVLSDNRDNGWDFYLNAVEVFTRDGQDSRKLETRLMFDRSRAGLPTIHVREPAKNNGGYDNIGFLSNTYTTNPDLTVSDNVRKTFASNFELMITSGNSLECVMIQEVIESAMLASISTLTIPFFELVDFNARELIMNDDLERNMLFIKTIGLNVKYEKESIPTLYNNQNIKIIQINNPTLLQI